MLVYLLSEDKTAIAHEIIARYMLRKSICLSVTHVSHAQILEFFRNIHRDRKKEPFYFLHNF